jgi:hypothetical protein
MANIFQRILQFATLGVFILAIAFVTNAFGLSTWKFDALGQILNGLKNVLSYSFYMLMAVGGYGPGYGISHANPTILYNFIKTEGIMIPFLNMMFHMTDASGNVVYYNTFNDIFGGSGTPIFQLYADQGIAMASNLYFLLFMLLFILSILFILLYLGRSDIKYSIYAVTCLALMLVIAGFPSLIKKILDLFGLQPSWYTPFFDEFFPNIIIRDLNFVAGTATTGSLWAAFFIYACLELSFQSAYVSKVSQPSVQRSRMLQEQMAVLGETSLQFEVEKKERETERAALPAGSRSEQAEERKRVTLRSFFTGAGLGAIREMVERRERERERTHLEEVSSDTRRLHGYITRLFEVDKRARDTLTAIGSAPSQKNLASTTLMNMGFRLLALLALVFLVTNPYLLYAVFNVPPIIVESYEFYSPEAVVTAIVPVAMIFPVISFAIRTYKQYRLTQFKAQREEESAMLKRLSELREIEESETVITDEEKKAAKEQKPADKAS